MHTMQQTVTKPTTHPELWPDYWQKKNGTQWTVSDGRQTPSLDPLQFLLLQPGESFENTNPIMLYLHVSICFHLCDCFLRYWLPPPIHAKLCVGQEPLSFHGAGSHASATPLAHQGCYWLQTFVLTLPSLWKAISQDTCMPFSLHARCCSDGPSS